MYLRTLPTTVLYVTWFVCAYFTECMEGAFAVRMRRSDESNRREEPMTRHKRGATSVINDKRHQDIRQSLIAKFELLPSSNVKLPLRNYETALFSSFEAVVL